MAEFAEIVVNKTAGTKITHSGIACDDRQIC
jgi:hypothetical protein